MTAHADIETTLRRQIVAGSTWRLRGKTRRVATVEAYDGITVQFKAPWSKTGVLRKCWDTFIAHYSPEAAQ